jgi:hypothetical protein
MIDLGAGPAVFENSIPRLPGSRTDDKGISAAAGFITRVIPPPLLNSDPLRRYLVTPTPLQTVSSLDWAGKQQPARHTSSR